VANYTEREVPYTRIIEHKHFMMGCSGTPGTVDNTVGYSGTCPKVPPVTVITREYPALWQRGSEPYYPINDGRNNDLFSRYQTLAEKETGVLFGGRLGQYRYYDMDKVIEAALHMVEDELATADSP